MESFSCADISTTFEVKEIRQARGDFCEIKTALPRERRIKIALCERSLGDERVGYGAVSGRFAAKPGHHVNSTEVVKLR